MTDSNSGLVQGLLNATFEAATLYVRTSILANGGAAAAWLAYMGVVGRQHSDPDPVLWFGIGMMVAWIASLVNYFGQRLNWEWARDGFREDDVNNRRCRNLIITAIILASLSPVAFLVGGVMAYCAL